MCGCKGPILCDKAQYFLTSGHVEGPSLTDVTTSTWTASAISNTLKRRLQRQRFGDRVLLEVTKANERLARHHGTASITMSTRSNRWTRWNRSQHNNYDYDDGSWSMVGKGQRKSKWGQDPWWDQAFALDARITQACAKQVAQALHLSLDGKGGKKGKGKGKGDKGDGAGKGDKVTQGQGWACSACQLWHTNPTCTNCRKCGVEHAVPPPGGQG